jgi:apolipoprotein N-acyltransferase
MANTKKWIYALSGGIAASLAWWDISVLFLLFCFVPLLIIEDNIRQSGDPVFSLFPYSFVFFFSWNLLVCWWMARIHFLGGMSVIMLNAFIMSMVFLLYSKIRRETGGGAVTLILLWAAYEFLNYRGDLSWPWLSLGNGLASNIKFIQWYEYTGTTGGTIWILLVNVILFCLIKRYPFRGRAISGYLLAVVLILVILLPPFFSRYIYNSYENTGSEIGYLILQPGLDPYTSKFNGASKTERLEHILSMAAAGIREDTEFIVTPETAVDSIWTDDPDDGLSAMVYGFLEQNPGVCIILGATTFSSVHPDQKDHTTRTDVEDNFFDIYNTAVLYCSDNPVRLYHKHYLANGVEQVPFERIIGFMRRISLNLGGVSGSLRKGDGPGVFITNNRFPVIMSTLICFESAYGEYTSRMVRMGANILIVMSNDGWFKGTGAYRQHLRLSQIRAVESRRSVVRAANTGISAHILQSGDIAGKIDWWEEGTLAANVAINNRMTLFSRYGDYPGRIALFFSVLMVLNLLVRSRLNLRLGERFGSFKS